MRARAIHDNYKSDSLRPRFIVLQSMLNELLEFEIVRPGSDLRAAMAAAIKRLGRQEWVAESSAPMGFTFIRRGSERKLLYISERHPLDESSHALNPFAR
jgi:hypothetical protein